MNKIWKDTFRKTLEYLKSASIPLGEWSFGGGTALMLYYQHRMSKDIDIFLSNAQYLTSLSPRLNDFAVQIFGENAYQEQSNYVKIECERSQYIDFILAPFLTNSPIREYKYGNQMIRVESPVEIVTKKIFYRSDTFKSRDIYDFGVVLKHREKELQDNMKVFQSKLIGLKERLRGVEKRYHLEVDQLELTGKYAPVDCLERVKKFVNKNI